MTKLQILLSLYQCISTHTLTWSVTEVKEAMNGRLCISTHTLTWSVTMQKKLANLLTVHFNSHAHVERDGRGTRLCEGKTISTHTLTWSVTPCFSSESLDK